VYRRGRLHNGALATPICRNDILRKMSPLETEHRLPLLNQGHDKERAYSTCARMKTCDKTVTKARRSRVAMLGQTALSQRLKSTAI
jgi:hypothetical protein